MRRAGTLTDRNTPRPRRARPGQLQKDFIIANIGIFTAQNDGYTGAVRTLTLNVNVKVKVKIVPNNKECENAPAYCIVACNFELGAAWKKVSKSNRP